MPRLRLRPAVVLVLLLLVAPASAIDHGAVGDANWQVEDAPPAPPAIPPPMLEPCPNVHLTEARFEPTSGHKQYHAHLKLHVSEWVPGGQLLLQWHPPWASISFTHVEGARRVSDPAEYDLPERAALSGAGAGEGVTVLELTRARHASPNCRFGEGALQGGACVLIEGRVDSDTPPSVTLRCAAGSATAAGYVDGLGAQLASSGCAMDEYP